MRFFCLRSIHQMSEDKHGLESVSAWIRSKLRVIYLIVLLTPLCHVYSQYIHIQPVHCSAHSQHAIVVRIQHRTSFMQRWQQQHRLPYELRICTRCNWHCVQDEEHVLLDCPSADLANLGQAPSTKQKNYASSKKLRQLFRSPSSSSNRLRDFISEADTKGLALFVYECLECCA